MVGHVCDQNPTALDPENEWLEEDPFLLGSGLFSGAMSLVLGKVAPMYLRVMKGMFKRAATYKFHSFQLSI